MRSLSYHYCTSVCILLTATDNALSLLHSSSMFLDQVTLIVAGGKGGDGCVAWRREKYVPKGGPDGGDGGRGGNVVLLADPNTDTLSRFMSQKRFAAKNGEKGHGKSCNGHGADDLILSVPPGTVVTLAEPNGRREKGAMIADLKEPGQRTIIAKGGRGGFGNAHFTSSTRQAPDFAELGEPGEELSVSLELKLVADIGIIGFPSVGKSSLIAAVSSARPKIADYEFTTLVPNLGVVRVYDREFVLCDVPGLIEGASEGKGLGDAFLKHIERCGILLHILDINRPDIVQDYRIIRRELEAYSPTLAKKKELVVLNKIDLVAGDASDFVTELKRSGIDVFAAISSATTAGTQELMQKLLPFVLEEKIQREASFSQERSEGTVPVLMPHKSSDLMGAYELHHEGDAIVVTGKRIEQFTQMTNFTNQGSLQRFCHVLERIGLIKALSRIRTKHEKVFIGKVRIDEQIF